MQSVLQAPVVVVSLASVLSSNPGLGSLEHLYHYGECDHVQRLGRIIFSGRWRIVSYSA